MSRIHAIGNKGGGWGVKSYFGRYQAYGWQNSKGAHGSLVNTGN